MLKCTEVENNGFADSKIQFMIFLKSDQNLQSKYKNPRLFVIDICISNHTFQTYRCRKMYTVKPLASYVSMTLFTLCVFWRVGKHCLERFLYQYEKRSPGMHMYPWQQAAAQLMLQTHLDFSLS